MFSSWLETAKETDMKKIINKAAETKKGIGNKKWRDTEDRVRTPNIYLMRVPEKEEKRNGVQKQCC